MNLLKKAGLFWSFDGITQKLLIEAFLYLGWARIIKNKDFPKVAKYLGKPMEETTYVSNDYNIWYMTRVSQAINIMSRHTFWESMCLVQAIAAMKMLEKRKIESTIYFGTAKDNNGKLIAHAWLRSGSCYITGYKEMHSFTIVGKFAKLVK